MTSNLPISTHSVRARTEPCHDHIRSALYDPRLSRHASQIRAGCPAQSHTETNTTNYANQRKHFLLV